MIKLNDNQLMAIRALPAGEALVWHNEALRVQRQGVRANAHHILWGDAPDGGVVEIPIVRREEALDALFALWRESGRHEVWCGIYLDSGRCWCIDQIHVY